MAKAKNVSVKHTGPEPEAAGPFYDDQERAADSSKDVASVKAVADPTNEGGKLPEWPADRADKGPGVESSE